MTNDATMAYAQRVARIRMIAEQLIDQCDDHFGIGPDDVQWGNVGDLGRIEAALTEIKPLIE